jgi:hypothetical protein
VNDHFLLITDVLLCPSDVNKPLIRSQVDAGISKWSLPQDNTFRDRRGPEIVATDETKVDKPCD